MEKKIAEIRKEFEAASFSEIPALIEAYWEDERSGVRNLIGKYEKKTGRSRQREGAPGSDASVRA